MRNLIVLILILVGVLLVFDISSRYIPNLKSQSLIPKTEQKLKVVNEQSVVIDVVRNVGPSVVTVGIEANPRASQNLDFGPFSVFFGTPSVPSEERQRERYIGSGFVVKQDGLIVTNKHVVDDRTVKYIIVDSKGIRYNVSNIYRDPLNDVAILRVSNPPVGGFREVKLGDSDKLEVGQFAIAIGTALGEFRNTVTTGVVSGLGRGITAGSPFEGFVERLDNVIQTDAAINPGNSGGPLLNSEGEVVGVNAAVASSGQNIGFAIPINVVRQSIKNFNETGQFNRPLLGVSYVLIGQKAAILNDLPQGALVREVVPGSAAQKAGVRPDDIITKIDGEKITESNGGLASIINKKKIGQSVILTIYRNGNALEIKATLEQSQQ